MKMSDLNNKEVAELHTLANKMRESLRTTRFSASGSRSRDVKHEKSVRRDIARLETEISLRRLADTKK